MDDAVYALCQGTIGLILINAKLAAHLKLQGHLNVIGAQMRVSMVLAGFLIATAAHAADIGPCQGNKICLSGEIYEGDAKRFAAIAQRYGPGTYVFLAGPGGRLGDALDIGDIIQQRHFSTAVSRPTGYCASACAVLFLSGYHAVIQRDSIIVFHQGYRADTGEPMPPDLIEYEVNRIVKWGGITERQARTLLTAVPPSGGRIGTEAWAQSLGFRYQIVPNFLWMWQGCQAKFCLAIP